MDAKSSESIRGSLHGVQYFARVVMYVSGIHVEGLRGAEDFEASNLERVMKLPGGPPGVAVADALSLWVASLDARRTSAILNRLGLARAEDKLELLVEEGFPTQVILPDAAGVPSLLPTDGSRHITVSVDVELDPPMFGRLRQLAVRDPRLVTALGDGACVTIKVGWLFTTDLSTISISILGVAVGETPFPVNGSEKPVWLPSLVTEVAQRFFRVAVDESAEQVARRLLDACLSSDPERRERYRRLAQTLEGPPFLLGRVELVKLKDRVEACFGAGLLRARQFGPSAADALRLVEAVILESPDVLIVEAPGAAQANPAAVQGWLDQQANGEKALLEQVIVVPGGAVDWEGTA